MVDSKSDNSKLKELYDNIYAPLELLVADREKYHAKLIEIQREYWAEKTWAKFNPNWPLLMYWDFNIGYKITQKDIECIQYEDSDLFKSRGLRRGQNAPSALAPDRKTVWRAQRDILIG